MFPLINNIYNIYNILNLKSNESRRVKDAFRRSIIDCFELKKRGFQFHFKATIKGSILRIESDNIRIRLTKNEELAHEREQYEIHFIINTTPYDVQHMALNYIKEHGLFDLLINERKLNEINPEDYALIIFDGDDDVHFDSNLNEEQRIAVEYIVQKEEPLPPYILYGPPGTGKTKTLVAAIEKIVKTTEQNVLVCAQTNQACDEISLRLMRLIKPNEMLRMYAKTHPVKKVDERLLKVSNLNSEIKSFDFPELTCLYGYRVVICTLCTSNCMVRARKHKLWKPDHFNFVIIDECANTNVPTALVSLAGTYI